MQLARKNTNELTETSMNLSQVFERDTLRAGSWAFFELILAVSLSVGCWFCYFSMFPNPISQVISYATIILLPVLMYFACKIPVIGKYMVVYSFLFVAIYLVILNKIVLNGFLGLANIVVDVLNENVGLGIIEFATTGDAKQVSHDIMMALLALIFLVSSAIAYSVFEKRIVLGFVMTAIPAMLGLFLKVNPSIWLLILLLLSWTGLFVLVSVKGPLIRRNNKPIYVQKEERSMFPIIFLVIVLGLLLLFVLLFSDDSYRPASSVDEAKQSLVSTAEHIRYDKFGENVDGLSFGNLKETHPLDYSGEVVLKVNMQLPRSIHLRGFVGGVYENDKWAETAPDAYAGTYKGLMPWLAGKSFYPQFQSDLLYRMSPYETEELKIENLLASSKYTYLPYEAALYGEIIPTEVNFRRDMTVLSRGIFGDRSYAVTMFLPELGEFSYAKTQARLDKVRNDPEYANYLEAENVYRNFVYDTYLEIPESAAGILPDIISEDDKGHSPDDVLFKIRTFFTDGYTYDTMQEASPSGQGELDYFINTSHAGDDMHFATVAALLLRQAGIPARYVEGYYLSPDDVKLFTEMSNVELEIYDSMAHSWVEIYVDEAGWLPAEVIPGYFTLEEEEIEQLEDSHDVYQDEQQFYPDEVNLDNDAGLTDEPPKVNLLNPLWIVLIGIVFLAIIVEMVGRLRIRKKLISFGSVIETAKVYEIYRYLCRVLKLDGVKVPRNPYDLSENISRKYDEITEDTGMNFEQFLRSVCSVRFGGAVWTDEEHVAAANYTKTIAAYIYKNQKPIKKFAMKHIWFIV